jgi:hypothetical protein
MAQLVCCEKEGVRQQRTPSIHNFSHETRQKAEEEEKTEHEISFENLSTKKEDEKRGNQVQRTNTLSQHAQAYISMSIKRILNKKR